MGSEVVIVPIIFLAFFMVVKTISDNRLRKHIADRALKAEEMKQLFTGIEHIGKHGFNTFKVGLLLTVLGLDLLIVDSFQLYEEIAFSVFFISGGLILILAEKLEKMFKD